MTIMALAVGLAIPLGDAAPAHAHDHWLEAEPPRVDPGKPSSLVLWVGEHFNEAERKPIPTRARYVRAELVGPGVRRDLRAELRENATPIAEVTPPAPGTWLIALDAAPLEIELPADKFNHYLDEEGLSAITLLRKARGESGAPGHERYTRSLKTLLAAGSPKSATTDDPSTRALGQELEIVPDTNPLLLRPGATTTLGFRVLIRGRPLLRHPVLVALRAGTQVTTRTVSTDALGHATLRLDHAGAWMIRLVHMERSAQVGADWRSYWASLTFTVIDGRGKGARPKR